MGFSSRTHALLAGASAMAMMFNSVGIANAADAPKHPLLETNNISYVGFLGKEVAKVAGPDGHGATAAFVKKELESKMKLNSDKPELAMYPDKPYNGDIVLSAVVAPVAIRNTYNTIVCLEGPVKDESGKVLNTSAYMGMWAVTPQGKVEKISPRVAPVAATKGFAFACRDPLRAERAAMIDALNAKNEQPAAPIAEK